MASSNMHEAKTRLSQLVDAVESGREAEVVIARNGRPAARLVPIAAPAKTPLRFGVAKGRFTAPEDINAHEDEIIALFQADGER